MFAQGAVESWAFAPHTVALARSQKAGIQVAGQCRHILQSEQLQSHCDSLVSTMKEPYMSALFM
jgi:hypothetical protein